MFYYKDTKTVSRSGEAQRKEIIKVREVTYYNDSSDPKVAEPIISKGFEIVEEIIISPKTVVVHPYVVGTKTVDNRNPNRVVKRDFTKKSKEN